MSISLLAKQKAFRQSLEADLMQAERVVVITAYMSDDFIELLNKCRRIDYRASTFIVNISDRVTRKSALKSLYNKAKKGGGAQNVLVSPDVLLHSKLILIYENGTPNILYIGSSNLTAGGFIRNLETNLRICAEGAKQYRKMFNDALRAVDHLKKDKKITRLDDKILDEYKERGCDDSLVARMLGKTNKLKQPSTVSNTSEYQDVTSAIATNSFLKDDVANPGQFTITRAFNFDQHRLSKFMSRPDGKYTITFINKNGRRKVSYSGAPSNADTKISFKSNDCQISAGRPIMKTFATEYLLVQPKDRFSSDESYAQYIERVKSHIKVNGMVELVNDHTLNIELKVARDCRGL